MDKNKFEAMVAQAETILLAGHLRPDGDCVGACAATYHYIKQKYPEKKVTVYLETFPKRFARLDPKQEIFTTSLSPTDVYDLGIALDSSSSDRLGDAEVLFLKAVKTLCVDHHISNTGYADETIVDAQASSTCEVLYTQLEEETLSQEIAAALYVGILCDSGGFRYAATSPRTMEIAGKLMATGIPFSLLADECFAKRSYTQIQLLGRTLLTSMRVMDGKCIVASITRRMMEFYGAKTEDIEGIIEQLRVTNDVEVAILLHEIGDQTYKISMRSNQMVDVSRIALQFGGGGHKNAAGCEMKGKYHDVINAITEQIDKQMPKAEETLVDI